MLKGFLNIPWFVWSAVALIVALIYSFIWPNDRIRDLTGFRFLILRWAHALTWLLLAVNFLLRGLSPALTSTANIVALAAGLAYVSFILITFVVR